MEELSTKLLTLENPYLSRLDQRDGIPGRALKSVVILEDEWEFGDKPAPAHVPDLQLGFARGYRISWQTALLGGMAARGDVFELNNVPWSGDHCGDDRAVPGILLSNKKLHGGAHRLYDLPVTILKAFGLDKPAGFVGRNVLGR